jgi:chromosomal replication initiator protein
MDPIWTQLLAALQRRIGHQDVEIWLRDARPTNLTAGRLVVEVPNRYYADWIAENYRDVLENEATQIMGQPVELELTFGDDPTLEAPRNPVGTRSIRDALPRAIGVNRSQRFDNFVVGECNKFAHAAASAVADNPARNYNPLFIYGSSGLGKTHLMHAIGNRGLEITPDTRVVYVTAEDFMNEMINCLRHKRMEDFRAKYRRRSKVLLVDDIQFLAGRERTQEEFFHTFNALQTLGRQIVLTSDVVPRKIRGLEPRLRTRFEGGLLADMQAPDRETLLAILLQKTELRGLQLPSDLADAIAAKVQGNIRELEGILNRLGAKHAFYREALSLDFARQHMPDVFDPAPPQLTVSGIIEAVARAHNLRSADITGSRRTRSLTGPRHIAMYLARKHTTLSFPELGREFGGRDHSTVQHGYRKVKRAIEDQHDPDLSTKVRLLEHTLNIRI